MQENYSNRQQVVNGDRRDGSYLDVDPIYNLTSYKTSQQPALVTMRTRQGNNLPQYHSFIKLGLPLPWTTFTFQETRQLYPNGFQRGYSQKSNGQYVLSSSNDGFLNVSSEDPLMPTAAVPQGDIITRVRNRSTQNLLKNIKDQKVNMGTVLAEGGKSLTMIANTATKIGNALSSLRKGNVVKAAQDLGLATSRRQQRRFNRTARKDQEKAIANAWLELQYGWKPLLSDVYNAAKEIADTSSPIFVGHATGFNREQWGSSRSYTVTNNYWPGVNTETSRGHCESRCKCVFTMRNTTARRAALNGLTNPAMVAWEVLPYSFVIDWFLPIGNYLELIDATSGLEFDSGGIVTYYENEETRFRKIRVNSLWRESSQGAKTKYISRGAFGSFPGLILPSFKNPVSVGHLLNAMALISTNRK